MATEIVMPRQGQSVEACTIVRWVKQPGENVGTGDVLCEIETDKAAFEVESTAAGILLAQFFPEGEEVPVLTPIATVGPNPNLLLGTPPLPSFRRKPESRGTRGRVAGKRRGQKRSSVRLNQSEPRA